MMAQPANKNARWPQVAGDIRSHAGIEAGARGAGEMLMSCVPELNSVSDKDMRRRMNSVPLRGKTAWGYSDTFALTSTTTDETPVRLRFSTSPEAKSSRVVEHRRGNRTSVDQYHQGNGFFVIWAGVDNEKRNIQRRIHPIA